MSTERLAKQLEELCHDWTIAHLCVAEMRRLAAENERLIEDRARFPDRPDDIGRMISAHIGNLKTSIKTHEQAWRDQLLRADALQRDADRYRFVRTADTLQISTEAARDPVAYDAAIDAAMLRAKENP